MAKKNEHKSIPAELSPLYGIGQTIASDEVGGIIATCFWYNDQWNYTIAGDVGVDRDLPPSERPGTLRLDKAYIAESRVKWMHRSCCGWSDPLITGEEHTCH
jgi:hypothetical protein